MNTKDIEKVDVAIANLLFAGLSLEQMKKIPKWLLENVENNKPNFRDTLTQHHEAEVEKAVEVERERIVQITVTNRDAFMMPATEQRWLNAITPTKTDKQTDITSNK